MKPTLFSAYGTCGLLFKAAKINCSKAKTTQLGWSKLTKAQFSSSKEFSLSLLKDPFTQGQIIMANECRHVLVEYHLL